MMKGKIGMNEYINNLIVDLHDKITDLLKDIREENKFLENDLIDSKGTKEDMLSIIIMKQNNRLGIIIILLQYLGQLTSYLTTTISEIADKNEVSKKSTINELEQIKQIFEQQFKDQSSKIEDTIKPLSEEIRKTLERQERNKDVYK